MIGLVICLLFIPAKSNAAKESLTIGPPRTEYKLEPGQVVEGVVKLKNGGDLDMDVAVYPASFAIKNEAYDQEFYRPDNILAANNWFQFSQNKYHLLPKTSQLVNYKINVPAGAEPGGHYAAIFAQTQSNNQKVSDVVEVKRVASLVYIEIAGRVTRDGSIESLKTNRWHSASPVTTQLRLKNKGNTHYRVDGFVTIKNLFGKEVSQSRINNLLLPNTVRLFDISSDAPDWPGLYKLEAKVSFPNGTVNSRPVWFIYLPHSYIYAAAVILFCLITVIFWRWLRKKKAKN